MSDPVDPSPLAPYGRAAAALLDLPIPDARWPAVLDHLALAQRLASVVAGHPLADADEPAPVFRP